MGKVKNKKKTKVEASQNQVVHKVQVVDKSALLPRAYRDQ